MAGTNGTTWVYEYDCGGNILNRKYYAYTDADDVSGDPIGTIGYEYDTAWKDKLVSYDGRTITYNSIGNMTSDGNWNYDWQAGRQLKRIWKPMAQAEYETCEPGENGDAMLEILLTGSNVLIEDSDTVTLTAKVTQNNTVVTDSLAASLFNWTRASGDAAADGIWNNAHNGVKSVQIAGTDLAGTTKFTCMMKPVADYGEFFPAVENGIVLKHEPGTANPGDTFSITDGILTVDTNASPTPYSFDNPMLSVNSTAIAGPLTAGMYVYTAAPTREIRFFYNADGLRTRKETVLGGRIIETTDYTLHGKLVTEIKHGRDVLHFFYDAQSRPAMVKWNGVMYSYVHNLQGDIVACFGTIER